MRQMLYKSKETMAKEYVISENDATYAELKEKGWLTADEIFALPEVPLPIAPVKPAEVQASSIGIDVDGDDKVDVRVSVNEGAASVAIAKPASVPAKQTSKRGRTTKRR